jgi:hypothetical protein
VDGFGRVRRLYWCTGRRLSTISHRRGFDQADIIVASYPRAGSLWLRHMLFEAIVGDATTQAVLDAIPYAGRHGSAPRLLPGGGRLVKSHDRYSRAYRRAIHLVRDPRDVAVSYFEFLQRRGLLRIDPDADAEKSMDRFIAAYLAGRFNPHGSWQDHLHSWLAARETGMADVLMVRYEDLRSDPASGLRHVLGWIGLDPAEEVVQRSIERSSIERMRSALAALPRPSDKAVINSGRVEGWRDALSPTQQGIFAVLADDLQRMGYPLD